MSELLPCPFCGGTKLHTLKESDDDWADKCFMSIVCSDCRAQSGRVFGSGDPTEWVEVREAWNRRSLPAAEDARDGWISVPAACPRAAYAVLENIEAGAFISYQAQWDALMSAAMPQDNGEGK